MNLACYNVNVKKNKTRKHEEKLAEYRYIVQVKDAFLSKKGTYKPKQQILTDLISLKIQIFV